jgi:hypothetical protein
LPQQTTVVTTTTLPAALDGILPFDVRVANQPRIWAHHRTIGDAEYYFIANTDLAQGGVATVHLRGEGRLEEWDAATGNVRPVPCTQHDGLTEVVLDFPPAGSHLLALHRRQAPVAVQVAAERVVGQMALPNAWTMTLGGPNSLTLDTAQVQIGDGEWSQPMHILDAHGVVARSGVGAPFGLRFTVAADTAPTGATYLAVESPERFTITVNGKEIGNADQGYWVDSAFRKVSLGRAIKAGRNEIVLRGVFARDSELESVYLLGDFGVAATRLKEESRFNGQVFDRYAPDARLTDLPASIASPRQPQGLAVDLTQNGLPFFAGRVKLSQTLALEAAPAKARLQIAGLRAALAHVRVNGKPAGTMAWQPHQVEVGGLKAGANTIEIELVGTLRNLLGPHHRNGGDKGWTGPNDFRDKQSWTDDYILAPFGFEGATLVLLD